MKNYLFLCLLPTNHFFIVKNLPSITLGVLLLIALNSCSTAQQLITSNNVDEHKEVQFIENISFKETTYKKGKLKINEQQNYNITSTIKEENTAILPNPIISYKNQEIKVGKANNPCLLDFIEEWYGVPYKFGGTTKNGIDCSAFVQELYGEVYNMDVVRTSREQFEASKYVKNYEDLKVGDLVFFKIRTRAISHVGVYLGEGKFIHASRSKGVVVSDLDHVYWKRYYVGGGRMRS